MLAIRRAVFGLAGGFTIADFYVNCVNLSDIRHASPPSYFNNNNNNNNNNSTNFVDAMAQRIGIKIPTLTPITTLKEDIEEVIQNYRLCGAALVAILISCGGLWSIIGASAAIIFDGDDGADRYTAVKDWVHS